MNENTTLTNGTNTNLFAVTAPTEGNANQIRYSTTTDTTDLFNIVTGKSENCKTLIGGAPIEVVAMAITGANVNETKDDENSPIVNKPVCHFLTADGKHYSSLSNGICRNAAALLEVGLTPTTETPIKIQFVTVDTKKGTAYTFNLVK